MLQDITLPRGQRLPPLSKPKQMLMVVSKVSKLNFSTWAKEPWIEALHGAGYPKVDPQALNLFEYLEFASSKSLLTTGSLT